MTSSSAPAESMDRTGKLVAFGVFVALVVDGMDLQMLSLALPKLREELGISPVLGGLLGTYTLLGMGVGGMLAGWLSDKIGRSAVTWWAVLVFTVCTGAIAYSRTYTEIALMRFVSGFGLGAVYSVGTLLAAEYVPTRIRTTVLGILQAGWSIGYVISALLASYVQPVYGWRSLFLFAIPFGILGLILLWGAPDPPSWHEARRQAAINPPKVGKFGEIWNTPSIRRTFILWSLTSIALQFGYYGANTWLPSYIVSDLGVNLQSMGWYVAATYAMMVVGKIITGYLADIVGRRVMWVAAGTITAVYLPVLIYFATPDNVAYLLLIFGLLYGAPYAVSATYMSESFPASVRGTAVGTSYNVGRIGSTISPVLIGGIATNYSIGLGIAVLGFAYALCGLIPGIFIREKMYDPKGVDAASTAPAASSLGATAPHGAVART